MCNSKHPESAQNEGEEDKSEKMEIGLINWDSHTNQNGFRLHWTDMLEVIIVIVLFIFLLLLVKKWLKKRNKQRLQKNTTAMKSLLESTKQSMPMTAMPMMRSTKGPYSGMENISQPPLALQGPSSGSIAEISPNFGPWTE